MPYILKSERENFQEAELLGLKCENPGQLNYVITKIIHGYLCKRGEIKYQFLNDIVGALESAKAEFQRRVVNPYEDSKISENGDL